MASVTIHYLYDKVKTRFRPRRSPGGRSIDDEARMILCEAVGREAERQNIASFVRECPKLLGGVELELRPRGPMPDHLISVDTAVTLATPSGGPDLIRRADRLD